MKKQERNKCNLLDYLLFFCVCSFISYSASWNYPAKNVIPFTNVKELTLTTLLSTGMCAEQMTVGE